MYKFLLENLGSVCLPKHATALRLSEDSFQNIFAAQVSCYFFLFWSNPTWDLWIPRIFFSWTRR